MHFRSICSGFAAIAALACTSADVKAHLPSPWTRTVKSANGQYILVALMPVRDRVERREVADYDPQIDQNLTLEELRDWDEFVTREKAIEAKYSESGVYRNDGSTEPLWLVPYLSACRDIFVSNDGQHVVAVKEMGSTCWDDDADFLAFYNAGNKIAGYDWQVLPCFWMRAVRANWLHVYFPRDESSGLDDGAGEFFIETSQGDVLAFALATGKRMVRRSPWPYFFGVPVVAVPLGYWTCRRLLNSRQGESLPTGRRFGFSLQDILTGVALLAGGITVVMLSGWLGVTSVVIAMSGASAARVRGGRLRALIWGPIAALYGGYMLLITSAIVDSTLLKDYPLLHFWLDDDWKRFARVGIVVVIGVSAGWLASRRQQPQQQKPPAS